MIPQPFKTLAYGTALSALLATGALAQQTAPGVDIVNTISLEYNTGAGDNVTLTDPPTVTFRVDRKIDLLLDTLTSPAQVAVTPGTAQASIAFRLDNKGNGTQGFILDVDRAGDLGLTAVHTATPEDLPVDRYWVFTNTTDDIGTATGIANFDPADASSGNISDIDSDESLYIWIVANVATTTENGLQDTFTLTATATDAGTTTPTDERRSANMEIENVIHADAPTVSSLDASVTFAGPNGSDGDQGRFLIDAPVITATKAVAVLDENMPTSDFNCSNATGTAVVNDTEPAFIPGACIEYTITVTNAASASANASNVIVRDEVHGNLKIEAVTDFVYTGDDASDAVTATPPTGDPIVSGTIGTLPPGVTATFRIRATIN